MLQGRDHCLVNECNHISPIFLEGVDCLDDWRDRVFAQDPIFVLLGVHPAVLDDTQTNLNDISIVH